MNPACLHCSLALPRGAPGPYCCDGCAAVSALLRDERLERYYELRSGPSMPVAPAGPRDRAWLEPLAIGAAASEGPRRVTLDVQGLHCAACVWLIEELFRRQPDAAQIRINPALGTVDLWISGDFPLIDFVASVERFGYRLGPACKESDPISDDLLLRLGICLALTAVRVKVDVARSHAAAPRSAGSGLSTTSPTGDQLRMPRDQRSGLARRARS